MQGPCAEACQEPTIEKRRCHKTHARKGSCCNINAETDKQKRSGKAGRLAVDDYIFPRNGLKPIGEELTNPQRYRRNQRRADSDQAACPRIGAMTDCHKQNENGVAYREPKAQAPIEQHRFKVFLRCADLAFLNFGKLIVERGYPHT